MRTIRSSRRSEVALVLGLSACAAPPSATFVDDGRRRPDGVAVDPLEVPPAPSHEASASEGVVALRSQLGTEHVRSATRAFFEAVAREDGEALMRVLTMESTWLNASSRAREPVFSSFARRFGRLDYTHLAGQVYWAEEKILRGDEAQSMWSALVTAAGQPARTPAASPPVDTLGPSDVVVRVAVSAGRTSTSVLFADNVVLALRRDGDHFLVHRVVEDFTLNP